LAVKDVLASAQLVPVPATIWAVPLELGVWPERTSSGVWKVMVAVLPEKLPVNWLEERVIEPLEAMVPMTGKLCPLQAELPLLYWNAPSTLVPEILRLPLKLVAVPPATGVTLRT
jgi:hypothetical protein